MKVFIADPRNRDTARFKAIVDEMRSAVASERERAELGRWRMRQAVEAMRRNLGLALILLAALLFGCAHRHRATWEELSRPDPPGGYQGYLP